ncbi:hypothetical protein D5086_027688 [Populus alba]|uniref:Uncharacterized protein n=1 Tax=Populus alba TaxID=43335 RepID=A0ACC4AWN4_POPAL
MLLSMFKQVKIGLLTTSVPFDPSLDPDLYLPLRAVENFSAKEMSMIRVEHQLWLCQVEPSSLLVINGVFMVVTMKCTKRVAFQLRDPFPQSSIPTFPK